jgi:hypothetical protein
LVKLKEMISVLPSFVTLIQKTQQTQMERL